MSSHAPTDAANSAAASPFRFDKADGKASEVAAADSASASSPTVPGLQLAPAQPAAPARVAAAGFVEPAAHLVADSKAPAFGDEVQVRSVRNPLAHS